MPNETDTDPIRVIAEALWNVSQGYTVEDVRAVWPDGRGRPTWHPDNPQDVADKALYMGHARQVLEHLTAAGWGDAGTRMDAHRQGALDAIDSLIEAVQDETASKVPLTSASVLTLLRGARAIVQIEVRRHA